MNVYYEDLETGDTYFVQLNIDTDVNQYIFQFTTIFRILFVG